MRAAWQILNRVMVQQFYLQHAGMFLFAFLFLFGIVDAGHLVSYHRSLMLSIISLPLFLGMVMLVWLLYNIKCMAFCHTVTRAPEGDFLYQLRALPALQQWLLYGWVGMVLYLPVLCYAIVLAAFSFSINSMVSWQVLGWQVLMILLPAASMYIAINKTSESFFTRLSARLGQLFFIQRRYAFFLPAWILEEKKVSFAVTKIFSLLLLGMLLVRNQDSFDADLFAIFYPLAILAHAMLVFHCVHFNESLLAWHRNLPLGLIRVAGMYLLTFCIVLLPDIVFLFLNNHGNLPLWQLCMEVITAMAVLFLFTGMALGCGLDIEKYLLFAFLVYIVILILQKSIGHTAAAAALAILSAMVFRAHYYSFEREF